MRKRPLKNVAHSVYRRLLNLAREQGRPFNEVQQYYAMERLLYRMAQSAHADKFVLKGALMLTMWEAPVTRPTRDIDLLGRMDNTPESVAQVFREACAQEVEPDGLRFDAASVRAQSIIQGAHYSGVRVLLRGYLGKAVVHMQIDVGFGDVIHGQVLKMRYPTILDSPAPELRGCTRESMIAEKFHAMAKLGEADSRMRDFYDIWLLSRHFAFEGAVLAEAIRRTFAARSTEVPADPVALTEAFGRDEAKQTQWRAFLRRSRIEDAPEQLGEVVGILAGFLGPVVEALAADKPSPQAWKPAGPWR